MNSTSNGTPILPGSNNSSTAGRAIDTYDRHYDGRAGNGTDEGVDYEHLHLAQTGQLTATGYNNDGFVVDDHQEPEQDDSQPLETVQTVESVTESRTTRTRRITCCSCRLDDSEDDEPMDSGDDDSDYEEQSTSEDESEADESEDDE